MERSYGPKRAKTPVHKKETKKHRWHDGEGRELTAGGILPYDDTGIWVIGEKNRDEVVYTDIGGKYQYQDCDIYKTIAREFGEELYHSSDLTREQVMKIKETSYPVYINGHHNKPVYVCYMVHTDVLSEYGLTLNSTKFSQARRDAVAQNPTVPEHYYNSILLRHMKYAEVAEILGRKPEALSYRLKGIIKHGILSGVIYKEIRFPAYSAPLVRRFENMRISAST